MNASNSRATNALRSTVTVVHAARDRCALDLRPRRGHYRRDHLDDKSTLRRATANMHRALCLLLWGHLFATGHSLQIQCYQCEELRLNDDCSAPENVANCTVNVQDACQKEVLVREQGTFYRKSCASSAACHIASAGYQSFCMPGRVRSVCISCCDTPLCNGPRSSKHRIVDNSAGARQARPALLACAYLFLSALRSALLWTDVPSRPAYAWRTP
ncbi:ly6/PLAUR domain-containing protein 1-like isoform X2 [Petromyzon marinus]|uniref:Ly6/PLAUR domain-containing protein 1-like isoform X1 n=2 Tax=Petromyzon marinus TaxID=7757 RepID=A0AAJ7T7K9_PETMA|nr:ly6/PLAUR domain-containing protein 1-like isoform X1 [Petromyzon marinus]